MRLKLAHRMQRGGRSGMERTWGLQIYEVSVTHQLPSDLHDYCYALMFLTAYAVSRRVPLLLYSTS